MSKPFVSPDFTAKQNLEFLSVNDNDFLGQCINKIGWSFHFSQLVNKAIAYEEFLKNVETTLEYEVSVHGCDGIKKLLEELKTIRGVK